VKKCKSNSWAHVIRALLIVVLFPLAGVFTGSTHGMAYAQERCQGEFNALNEAPSGITSKPAIQDHRKTGQRN
jgi:hypothetical protein